MEGSSLWSAPNAKVPISRIKKPDQRPPKELPHGKDTVRTLNKACTECRTRTRCSADRPRCQNCEKLNLACVYEATRRDRLKESVHKNEVLTSLLEDISPSLDDTTRLRVTDVLHEFENKTPPPTTQAVASVQEKRRRVSSLPEEGGHASHVSNEDQVSASVGLNESLDFLDEDLLGDSKSSRPGFMGRNAQIQWLRTLQRKLDQPGMEPSDPPHGPPGANNEAFSQRAEALHERQGQSAQEQPLSHYYFYLDDTDVDTPVPDPHAFPPADRATILLDVYRNKVHDPFRMLDDALLDQVADHIRDFGHIDAHTLSVQWKVILNLVFATAARFMHLTGNDEQSRDRDYLVYGSRAMHFLEMERLLTVANSPELWLIQAIGLLSFYCLSIGHVSRAWYMIGTALRCAQAAGLHLRNENPSLSTTTKRTMAQTWWALHSIECVLTSITGRPRIIAPMDCTVPYPMSLKGRLPNEHNANILDAASSTAIRHAKSPRLAEMPTSMDLFVHSWVKLDDLQHKILSRLYSARTAAQSWKHMQTDISSLTSELEAWAVQELPSASFPAQSGTDSHSQREFVLLRMYYQSAKICITRPCLCRLDRRIKGQSTESARFSQVTAKACIDAALHIGNMLPESSDPSWLYQEGPWWCAVHVVMQAITVLLLEVAQESDQPTRESQQLITSVHRLAGWLEAMSTHDSVADRALTLVRQLLGKQNRTRSFATAGASTKETDQQRLDEASHASWSHLQAHEDPNHAHLGLPSWNFHTHQPRDDSTEVSMINTESAFVTEQPFFMQNDLFSNPFDEYVDFTGGFPDFEPWDAQQHQEDQQPPQ